MQIYMYITDITDNRTNNKTNNSRSKKYMRWSDLDLFYTLCLTDIFDIDQSWL